MINIIALFFTATSLSSYEPIHLLLGVGIGVVIILVLVKKLINRKNKQK